ncbi:MAG: peptidylprolyl isomerase [bacterium]|jgi:parvulin-like peptidyl-prolyl isomerase
MKNPIIMAFLSLSMLWTGGCSQEQQPDQVNQTTQSSSSSSLHQSGPEDESKGPVILKIRDKVIHMVELEQLGMVALSKENRQKGTSIEFDSPEGQAYFKKIAPNLYNTLIDIYVIQLAAEESGHTPTDEAVNAEFQRMKETLSKQGQYETFLQRLGVDENGLRKTILEKMAMENLQKEILLDTNVSASETDITDFYYQNRQFFKHPQKVRLSHIFLSAPQDQPEETRQQVRQRAEQLRGMIGDNPAATFPGLSRKYSEDPATAPRGGDMGFVKRDDSDLDKNFVEKAFALQEGEVSEIIDTPMGFHIVWSTDHEQSLEEARNEIRQIILQQKQIAGYTEWLEETRRNMNINRLFDPETFEMIEDGNVEQTINQ